MGKKFEVGDRVAIKPHLRSQVYPDWPWSYYGVVTEVDSLTVCVRFGENVFCTLLFPSELVHV